MIGSLAARMLWCVSIVLDALALLAAGPTSVPSAAPATNSLRVTMIACSPVP
jgi:hypothetical protein